MASIEKSGIFPPIEKVPVQCLDDPFGFDAEVVYGHESLRLKQCTVFLTSYRTQQMATTYVNERPGAEAEDTSESGHQRQGMSSADIRGQPNANQRPVRPEDTNAHNNFNHLLFTDGGPPLTMATGGTGYKSRQTESPVMLEKEEWDNHSRTRMKKGGKRGGKKSRRRHRKAPNNRI